MLFFYIIGWWMGLGAVCAFLGALFDLILNRTGPTLTSILFPIGLGPFSFIILVQTIWKTIK